MVGLVDFSGKKLEERVPVYPRRVPGILISNLLEQDGIDIDRKASSRFDLFAIPPLCSFSLFRDAPKEKHIFHARTEFNSLKSSSTVFRAGARWICSNDHWLKVMKIKKNVMEFRMCSTYDVMEWKLNTRNE